MKHRSVDDRSSLSGIRKAIRADLANADADPSLCFDCLIAVTEACTNALTHSLSRNGESHPVVWWDVEDSVARFWIEDFSDERWSMSRHPSRSVESVTVDLDDSVGLDLMKDLMDEVVVNSVPQGTMVALTKNVLKV